MPKIVFADLRLGELADDPENGSVRDLPYFMVQNGFFLGDGKTLAYYPMPSEKDLQTRYYEWWRSASM